MKITKKETSLLFLAVISIIILVIIYKWIDYLSTNDYVYYVHPSQNKEGFGNSYISDGYVGNQSISTSTSKTVNLPLNTTYSCKNMCGPTSRCSITGQQCLADIDCPGCQPNESSKNKNTEYIPSADNDAGKLTGGVTPTYSTLTTDIGTNSAIFYNNTFKRAPPTSNGVNTWRSNFNASSMLYDSKFKPPNLTYMPIYTKSYSVTGEFIDNGPLASNAYIRET